MSYSWEISSFDSEIFGQKVARITSNNKVKTRLHKTLKSLIEDLKESKIWYATYRVNANFYHIIHELEKYDFLLVDGLITLETMPDNKQIEYLPKQIRHAKTKDIKQLLKISGSVFAVTRYYHDPLIPKEKADIVYQKWVTNSLSEKSSKMVLVWEKNKKILGLTTLDKKGQIILLGVSEKVRGKGIGRELIKGALNKFRELKRERVIVETQITNIPALRLYQSLGFKIIDSFLTYRWYRPDKPKENINKK